jgi:hypothetical protein
MTARGALSASWCSLDLSPAPPPAPAEEELGFPIIHKDDRSELTFILNAGGGVYSDVNPWFGQPELFNEFNPACGRPSGQ